MSHKIIQKIARPKQFNNKDFAIFLIEKNCGIMIALMMDSLFLQSETLDY